MNTLNILIIHFNTPELTLATIKSINKQVKCNHTIYLFDNSTKYPFIYYNKFDNIVYLDNTKGQIIDFFKLLNNYTNKRTSTNGYGSFKHTVTVDKCFDIINDNFILLDSDVIVKKDISELYNDEYCFIGKTHKGKYPRKFRIWPILLYINIKMCRKYNIRFFDKNRTFEVNNGWYDTGASFYEDCVKEKLKYKEINIYDYINHLHQASHKDKNIDEFLFYNKCYYATPIEKTN